MKTQKPKRKNTNQPKTNKKNNCKKKEKEKRRTWILNPYTDNVPLKNNLPRRKKMHNFASTLGSGMENLKILNPQPAKIKSDDSSLQMIWKYKILLKYQNDLTIVILDTINFKEVILFKSGIILFQNLLYFSSSFWRCPIRSSWSITIPECFSWFHLPYNWLQPSSQVCCQCEQWNH